jgi:hypothetical protein
MNLQKSVALLHITMSSLRKKCRKTISLTVASKKKKIKYLGINLTNDVNDLHEKNLTNH